MSITTPITTDQFARLRAANTERNELWAKGEPLTLVFRGCELAGEYGEMQQELVAVMDAHAIQGNVAATLLLDLGSEIADVVICTDLIAMDLGVAITPAPLFGRRPRLALNDGPIVLGMICNAMKKLERERLGLLGSRADKDAVQGMLTALNSLCAQYAASFGIDLWEAVVTKFNETSIKVGFPTRLDL